MNRVRDSVEEFASQTPKNFREKRYSWTGLDWPVRDIKGRSQADLIKKYTAWKNFIGYDALTPGEKKQVDTQWDDWVSSQEGVWKWDPTSQPIKALRARGPLTRAYYGQRSRKTPTGPNEATSPFAMSILQALPKKKSPEVLTEDIARSLLQEVGGDPAKARQLAKERGYSQ